MPGSYAENADEYVGINPLHGLLQVNTAHSLRKPVQYMETDRLQRVTALSQQASR
jgi:hypothetical protein